MVINNNSKEPGKTKYNKVHDDQHATAPDQINFTPGSPNYHSKLYITSKYSTINSKSSESVTPDKGNPRKNIVQRQVLHCEKIQFI